MKLQDIGQIDAVRVGDAGTVAVGHERIDGQDDGRAAQEIRPARIAGADAALSLRRVGGELDEFLALGVVALHQLARREVARSQEHLSGFASAANEALRPVPDEIDGVFIGSVSTSPIRWQLGKLPRVTGALSTMTATSCESARQSRSTFKAPVRVGVECPGREVCGRLNGGPDLNVTKAGWAGRSSAQR